MAAARAAAAPISAHAVPAARPASAANPADTQRPRAAGNAADGDLPATLSENSPEGRKRKGRSGKNASAREQLDALSLGENPGALWENDPNRDDREPIRITPADAGRLTSSLTYKRLQVSVARFYLGNRLRKQYEMLEAARDKNRLAPGAVRDQAGLFIEARTKGLAGRVYPLGLDILDRPSLVRDAHGLFDKFFAVDAKTRGAWEAYARAALESPRAKIPSQLKKALFAVLQDAASVPKEELAAFFDAQRAGIQKQSDQFLPYETQERVIQALKAAASRAALELNAALLPGRRVVGISLLGSYVTRTARPDSDLDFHVVSEDGAESTRARFVERLTEIWEKMGRGEELGAFQYALPAHAGLIARVYEKPGNLPYRMLSPYADAEAALQGERSAVRWSGAKPDLYSHLFELSFRGAARLAFLWWDFKNLIKNKARAAWLYHGLQIETIRFFFGTRAAGLRTKYFQWREETKDIVPAVKDLEGLLLHWRAEAYTGAMRPLGPEVADRRAVEEAGLRIWDKYYPKNPAARAAFERYIARVKRVAPAGRPSYFRKQVFQVFYETLKLEEGSLITHIDGMLDDAAVEAKLEYGRAMKPRVQAVFRDAALEAIKRSNAQVPHAAEIVAVVLLGSYATGTPGPGSDLDYMVVTRDGSKTALKTLTQTLASIWETTEFYNSPLGPFQYAVPPNRRLLELTHPEGYLVFAPENGVSVRLSSPVPADSERAMPAWKRLRGRVFAEVWKAYLKTLYRALDARDALFGRNRSPV